MGSRLHRATWRDGDRRSRRGRSAIPQGARSGRVAGPRSGRAFDRGQADPSEHQQARQPLRSAVDRPRGAILLLTSEPGEPRPRRLALCAGSTNPSQQGRRRLGQQVDPDRLGHPDEARHRLFAVEGDSPELTKRPQHRLQGKVMTKRLIDLG